MKKPSNRRLSRGTRGGIPAASATRCFAHPSRDTAGRSPRAPSMRRTRPWVPRHCPSARTRPRSASARDMRCHRARTRPSVPARTTGPRVTPLWDRSPSPFAQTPPSSPSIARTDGPTFRRTPPTRAGRKPSPRALPRRKHIRRSLTRPRTSARRRSGPPRDGTCATAAPVPETPPRPDEPPVPGRTPRGLGRASAVRDTDPRGMGTFGASSREQRGRVYLTPEHERAMLGSCSPGPATAMNVGDGVSSQRRCLSGVRNARGFKFGGGDRFSQIHDVGMGGASFHSNPGPGAYHRS